MTRVERARNAEGERCGVSCVRTGYMQQGGGEFVVEIVR